MFRNKPYESLTIRDPFIFGKIAQNPNNARLILSALLARDINIDETESEKRIQLLSSTKYVRLDLLAIDENGTNYDAEMQNKSNDQSRQKELPKRSRYYQCMLDGQILESGADYLDMNDTFIIFICDFDPFDFGLYQYTFVQSCVENDKIKLNDGAIRIFFNLSADNSTAPEITRNMLGYFLSGEVKDSSTQALEREVSLALEKEEWRQEYMLTWVHDKDVYNEGRSEGFSEGEVSGSINTILKLVHKGLISKEQGAIELNITLNEIESLLKEN